MAQVDSTREGAKLLNRPRATVEAHISRRDLADRIQEARRERQTGGASAVIEDRSAREREEREAELRHLKKEVKKLTDAVVNQEAVFDRIVDATRVPVEVPKLAVAKQDSKKPARSVVLPIYDQQYGQFVRPTDTPGGKGSFDAAVFDQRLARWVEGVTGSVRDYCTAHRLEEVIIPLGGDQVEGDEIFPGQAWQLEMGPPQQVWQLACKLEAALKTVIRFAREEVGASYVGLYAVPGNHGKVGGKKSGARPADYSWDWLLYKILFDKLRAEPIDQFGIEVGGALFFRAGGHEFQAIHGDQIRGWGGLPFYGLAKFDGRSIRLHSTIYRYLLMGHHHQPATIPNGSGETIVSGDWVGANNLSAMMTAASRPQQNILFVAEKWGITETARIYFQEAEEAYATPPVYGLEAA